MGGAAFALANLLLARELSAQEYGELALVLAITNMSIPLGPLSMDAIVLRHRPGPLKMLLGLSVVTGIVGGVIVAGLAHAIYPINVQFLPIIVLAISAGSITRVAASVFQSENRFRSSLSLIQGQNLTLILGALAVGIWAEFTSKTVFSAYAAHWMLAAIAGWLALRFWSGLKADESWKIPWGECIPLIGYLIAAQLTIQLERLVIPKFLDLESLALFGVMAALVLAPFKMFEVGVGYTLIPGLRTAATKGERKGIVIHEVKSATVVVLLATVSGFLLAPWIADLFLHGKYVLSADLIGACVIAGTLQISAKFVASIVTALGNRLHLARLTRGSWGSLLIAILCGWWASQWGLPGIIVGLAIGSLARIIIATWIAMRVWRQPELIGGELAAPVS